MKSLFEQMGGTYRREGDYWVPDLKLREQEEYQIGKYGRMHLNFLKEHRPILYSQLILKDQLWERLVEIDKSCQERMEHLVSAMKNEECVTEALKATEPFEWVRQMNNIHNRAEEMIMDELIYHI